MPRFTAVLPISKPGSYVLEDVPQPVHGTFYFEGKSKVEAAESRITEAKRAVLPDFQASVGTNSLGGFSAGLQMSVPLWYLWNEKEGVKAAESSALAEEARLQSLKRNLLQAFEQKVSQLKAQDDKLGNYTSDLIPISEKAFHVALHNYSFGKIDYSTLTNSADSFVNSRLEYEALLTTYLITRAELEELVGGEL